MKNCGALKKYINLYWHFPPVYPNKRTLYTFSTQTMDPFVEYLKTLKTNVPLKTDSVGIVMGNESCDLDSTICSLTLAYFLNKTNNDPAKTVLPLINGLQCEFPLRTENIYVLNNVGIKKEDLIYRDTINMDKIKQDKNVEVVLVDHHVLSAHYESLKANVKKIFDHRPLDANASWDDNVVIDRKIVGSCCTLIADEILKKSAVTLTPTMAKILYETIIFDTIGLSKEAGKVKDLDITICSKLEGYLNMIPNPVQLFDELWSAHNDVSKLSPKQLLAKDLKIIENILIPGLPMLAKEYLKQCDILNHIQDFCVEKKCEHVILMGLEAKGMDVKRDLAFYSYNKQSKLLQSIIEKLKNVKDYDLQEDCSGIESIRYFRQNPKFSRKQIVPQVQEVLNQSK